MTPAALRRLRFESHGLMQPHKIAAVDVVRSLGAVQAQDYSASLWAIGSRIKDGRVSDVEQAIADSEIVRTWPMRGTLHFVACDDVRWMLRLLTPRIRTGAKTRLRQLGLDSTVIAKSEKLFARALSGDRQLARPAMMALLDRNGISTEGQRGYHLLWHAAQTGLICFGPKEGKQHTFVLLDEWIGDAPEKFLSREDALSALALRYFSGHGPATPHDFAWWAGLTLSDARIGLRSVEDRLAVDELSGRTYYFHQDATGPRKTMPVRLLAGFDEYILAYRDRGSLFHEEHQRKVVQKNGIFSPTVLVNGRAAATWKRPGRNGASLQIDPLRALPQAASTGLAREKKRYQTFFELA